MVTLFFEVGEIGIAGVGEEEDKSVWGRVKLALPVGYWNGAIKQLDIWAGSIGGAHDQLTVLMLSLSSDGF